MSTLPTDLRSKLERTCIAARKAAEPAARDALFARGVTKHRPPEQCDEKQRALHSRLRARAQQLGDLATYHATAEALPHLVHECAYEHWHRMLFARFLAENDLLMLIEAGERPARISLKDCKELAEAEQAKLREEAKAIQDEAEAKRLKAEAERINQWTLAGRYAQTMLPEIFRADDPVLQVPLAREDQLKLEQLLDGLAQETFTASDSLGWSYQFWQTQRKKEVNDSEVKIGADELPSVTQLFTEDYMVDFLLDNTLGAWWAGKEFTAENAKNAKFKSEEEARRFCALPGCPWKYLRFIQDKDGKWTPAAGTFDGWPKTAKELKCLDPCMGSGHFVVAMFERLVALRMAEEKLDEAAAVAAVIRSNLFGLEIDPRCTQIGAFNLALAAWRRVGHCKLPAMNLACSGLAPNTRETDWLALAGDDGYLKNGMARLFQLFKNAPVLGSLINPRVAQDELLEAAFHKLQPLLEKALAQETKDDTAHEMAVTARGLAKAAEILAGQFTLVATNVPFKEAKQLVEPLQDYIDDNFSAGCVNLATAFVQRITDLLVSGGSCAAVTPHEWLFLGSYEDIRVLLLTTQQWRFLADLGERAFESPQAAGAFTALIGFSRSKADSEDNYFAVDATSIRKPAEKAEHIRTAPLEHAKQADQLRRPNARIGMAALSELPLLSKFAESFQGTTTGDNPRFVAAFWELPSVHRDWEFFQATSETHQPFSGTESILRWEGGAGPLSVSPEARIQGQPAFGRRGVFVAQMRKLPATLYGGQFFSMNGAALVPIKPADLTALWTFCASPEYHDEVRKIDKKKNVTNATLVKVPFDLAHWQKVAAEKYPHGLPTPFSSDPTQWLFNGHPGGADQPLHVAVARLLGYQWPRQTGSSFPDCPALGPDGLEKLADDDGIVCLPSVRGEAPAAERLRKLLAVAFGKDWKAHTELELIRASGSDAGDLEEWLRKDFFAQHCDLFQQRPFVWHIWDGRKRDGFHALVNYHTLAGEKGKGRRTLESLTHSYLGDWITRQKHGVDPKHPEEGADERLAAALALKETLEAIIEGEGDPVRGTGFDIFVRWKPLAQQAIGWNPDINDGVRMNIRPFLASDIPGGNKGAGILRAKPNIKWDKDRGKEPHREKKEFPWFWSGSGFTGHRVNDIHLTREQKEKARK